MQKQATNTHQKASKSVHTKNKKKDKTVNTLMNRNKNKYTHDLHSLKDSDSSRHEKIYTKIWGKIKFFATRIGLCYNL